MYGRVEILLVFGILISVISIAGTDSAFSYYFSKTQIGFFIFCEFSSNFKYYLET